jgi:uncharacterized membrane protein YciS (DUF1049 family)
MIPFITFIVGLVLGFFVAAALYVSAEAETKAAATNLSRRSRYGEKHPQEYGRS